MNIVLIGMKGCGKTTVGNLLAQSLAVPFIDCDAEIEKICQQEKGETLPFRQIFARYGTAYFHELEAQALRKIVQDGEKARFVLSCGGGTPLYQENQEILRKAGKIVFLDVAKDILLQRILAHGIPAFFPYQDNPQQSLDVLLAERLPIYQQCADITLHIAEDAPEAIVATILQQVGGE